MRHSLVVDYEDFKEAVGKAKKQVDVLDMEVKDFFKTEFSVTQYTLNHIRPRPYIENIRMIMISKGRYEIGNCCCPRSFLLLLKIR